MEIPNRWRSRKTGISWAVFAFLSLPVLVFAIVAGTSDGFTIGRILAATILLLTTALTSRLLWYGLLKGSLLLVAVAVTFVIVFFVAYAAAISVLVDGLKINVL